MSLTTWTTDQMLSLAPDALLARASERMAHAYDWLALGHDDSVLWGVYPNGNRQPFHVLATLPDLAFHCDCPSRKRPCRHVVNLALLAARESDSFVAMPPPAWVREKLAKDQPRPGEMAAPALAVSLYEERLRNVRRGMRRFERWLKDTVHRGLAGLPATPIGQWNEMAARLSEAGAVEVAQDLRELRGLAGRGSDWPEIVLRRLGRLYLLTRGFARYDSLQPEAQADLRGAVGWFEDPHHPGDERLADRWLILATVSEQQGHRNLRRTWLYGQEHRRFAFVAQELQKEGILPAYFSGTTLTGTLRFAPGGWPQRASFETIDDISPDGGPLRSFHSLRAARAAYGKALSLNPWLRRFPMALSGVRAELDGSHWVLRDSEGYAVPLPPVFMYGWHLQVMSDSARNALFGEWDGRNFTPLSAYYNDSWLALHVLRGQK